MPGQHLRKGKAPFAPAGIVETPTMGRKTPKKVTAGNNDKPPIKAGGKPAAMEWGRLVLINFTVLISLLLVLLAGGEVYYRYFCDSTDSFGLSRVTKRWFERHYRMNNAGFRDNVEYKWEPVPVKPRVLFVGDSFTAGHGIADVDKRFANIIRKERPDREVFVLAVNGFDTGLESEMLANLLRRGYQPGWVVLVYSLNDIADIVPEWDGILKRIYEQDKKPGFLARHSYFIDILNCRLKALRDPDIARYYQFVKAAYEGPLMEAQQKRLAGLNARIKAAGGKLLVVTFPFMNALGPGYEYRAIHENLDRFWEAQGVPHLDLLPVFEGQPVKKLTLNRFDPHPNEAAHALAAEAIGDFLDSQVRKKR